MQLTLSQRRNETHDTEAFLFEPESKFDFVPGQYLKWSIPDEHADDRGTIRFFSISSSPTEKFVQLTTKFNAERSSSFKAKLKQLRIGDQIEVRGPSGAFVLPEDEAVPVILIAGGIGITPFRSMLKYQVDKDIRRPVHLIYGVRSDQDMVFKSELEEWSRQIDLKISWVVGKPINDAGVAEAAPDYQKVLCYLSGPEPMVRALQDQLAPAGLPADKIKTDYFPGYSRI